ncbi:hypothetical protein [Paenibacillus koleovorans]|uniref:hypothetical protein n=1 Tax=Paenibacillus koleovorans TaxID=121608 RepID=UPI000FD75B5F|nr:hypothetical protein [Paenibacillus koleovorans]
MNRKAVWIFGVVVAVAIGASAISDHLESRAQAKEAYQPIPLMKFDGSTITYNKNIAVCH